jgi:DNA modification methylase
MFLKTVIMDVDSLVPYARNSRKHDPAQVSQIKSLMLEFGWTNPILADFSAGNMIVAGHGRQVAAQELYRDGHEIKLPSGDVLPRGKVPVIDCSGWSEAQRKAYVIADNKSALNSTWDFDMLKVELEDLKLDGFDLSLTCFNSEELNELFAVEVPKDKDPDDAPDVPVVPHSKLGDTWILGPHRVRCGDSTKFEDWDALMSGELCDAVWTDPPYNVAYESKLAGSIKNDNMGDSNFHQFLLDFYSCVIGAMKPGAPIYVAHADTEGLNFRGAFKAAGFKLSGCLVWKKNSLVLGRSDYQWMHEPILYGWKPGSSHKWYGGRKQVTVQDLGDGSPFEKMDDGRYAIKVGDSVMYVSGEAVVEESPSSVIYCEKPKRSAEHPTMKPTALIEKMLKHSARPGDIIVDGFGGSGSTLMAADRMGMSARLMEFDPKFVDVICRRWANYTGRTPVHAVTGEKFPVDVAETP